jgi:TRAP-type mannitol/chloroaromatic compound transport system permease small subunit
MSRRARVWMEMIGAALFLFAYCLIVVKFGFAFAERSFATGEVSAAQTGLDNRWAIKAVLPIGFMLLGASGVAAVLRSWVYLYGPEVMRPRVDRYAVTHDYVPSDVKRPDPLNPL